MNIARIGGRSLVPVILAACSIAPHRVDPAIAAGDRPGNDRAAPRVAPPREATSSPRILGGVGKSYTIGKVGIFLPSGDIDSLDDGVSAEVVFGRQLLPFLSLEGSLGYLATDGQAGGSDFDLWAIPAFVNARVSVPALVLEPYAGVGVGGLYADYESGAFASDDVVGAWSAFLGIEVGVGRLAVGAEYKFMQTEDTDDGFAIEGSTVSVFASLPF